MVHSRKKIIKGPRNANNVPWAFLFVIKNCFQETKTVLWGLITVKKYTFTCLLLPESAMNSTMFSKRQSNILQRYSIVQRLKYLLLFTWGKVWGPMLYFSRSIYVATFFL